MEENDENQRRLKDEAEKERIEVIHYSNLGYQSSRRICQTARWTWEEERRLEKRKRRKNQACDGIICWFSDQGPKGADQSRRWKNDETHLKSIGSGKSRWIKKKKRARRSKEEDERIPCQTSLREEAKIDRWKRDRLQAG